MLSNDSTGWLLAIALLPTLLLLAQGWQARPRILQHAVIPIRLQPARQPRR